MTTLSIKNNIEQVFAKDVYIEEKLMKVIRDLVGEELVSSLSKDALLNTNFKDLGLDSLSLTEFAMNVEDEFEIHISEEDFKKFTTIRSIVEIISSKLQS